MKGREVHNMIKENETMKMIKDYPLLVEWYYDNDEHTPTGKNAYCRYILSYFKSLAGDVNKVETFAKTKQMDINKYMISIKYYIDKNGNKKMASASYRNARLAAVRSFYGYLVKAGYIKENPCDNVKNPRTNIEKDVVYLEPKDIEAMKKVIDDSKPRFYPEFTKRRDKLLITIGTRTGLRESAITEINLEDIDYENQRILVTEKGNVTREVYIGAETIKEIKEFLPYRAEMLNNTKCDALFVSMQKDRMVQNNVYYLIKKYSTAIGKPISPHKMRSTCAVNLYESTSDIYLVKEVLGHKNIANTQKYARVSANKKKAAADILDNI